MRAVVIEDSKTQAHRLAGILGRRGFQVDVAFDGETGLDLCRGAVPDVVVSDILMPGIDGYEVCRRLRADPGLREVPVMLLTSLTDPMDVVRALAAGASSFVTKPYEEEELVRRVRRLIQRRGQSDDAVLEIQGERFRVEAARPQILEILVCALEDAAKRNSELEAGRVRLEHANAQRDELMAVVAHELKTPLSTMLARAQLALGSRRAEATSVQEWRALGESVVRQVQRMVTIINDLQDAAHVESGEVRIHKSRTDLVEVAREVIERLRATTSSHALQLQASAPAYAEIDAGRIEQVLTNLLTNALKYSPKGGVIEVGVETREGVVRVHVRDEGIGIAPDVVPHLFDRYFRSRQGQATAKGLGLGLYVSKRIVELHGGCIGVETAPGKGSTFWFEVLQCPTPVSDVTA